ncbi:MAG: putative alpha-dextrin endo,6-alpha-glucosidase [Flaviaesturariibacter sp.]|nr:putative alpha-dextrin endo,6-alpha-glucosidase [Flaviaesturariibacter sp.]
MNTPKNVWIIDNAFYMPQLKRWRRIWLYLPDDYATSNLSYPVLYMHDGQNLFEEWSSFGEEWQVDETIDGMQKKSIVVGIDNGAGHRINEYKVEDHPSHGPGEGRAYLRFITDTLKPYIDAHFRTRTDRASTTIAGSSMGGLISFYGALLHPDVFGNVGVFSPSFWLAGAIDDVISGSMAGKTGWPRFYFYAGEKEGEKMADHVREAASLLRMAGAEVQEVYDPNGEHSEENWRAQFPQFYEWTHRDAHK